MKWKNMLGGRRIEQARIGFDGNERRRGFLSFLTWAFFLSDALANNDALATGRHAPQSDEIDPARSGDQPEQLSLSRPDADLTAHTPEPTAAGPDTATLLQPRAAQELSADVTPPYQPEDIPAGTGAETVVANGSATPSSSGIDIARADAASEAAADMPDAEALSIQSLLDGGTGIRLDLSLPDTADGLLGAVGQTVDNLGDAVTGLTNALVPALTPIVSEVLAAPLNLVGGLLSAPGSIEFGHDTPQPVELMQDGRFTDFGISMSNGAGDVPAGSSTLAIGDGPFDLADIGLHHLGDAGDGASADHLHDNAVRIAGDLLT